MVRKSVGFMLAEYQLPVDFHVKDSSGSFDQFWFEAGGFLDGCCQTGSFGRVVSYYAVGDADFHCESVP